MDLPSIYHKYSPRYKSVDFGAERDLGERARFDSLAELAFELTRRLTDFSRDDRLFSSLQAAFAVQTRQLWSENERRPRREGSFW